jgi:DNA-binding transcriptional ArsR family regulator
MQKKFNKTKFSDLTLEKRLEILERLNKCPSGSRVEEISQIALELNVSRRTMYYWATKLKDLESNVDTPKLYVKGVSTLTDSDGNVKMQWTKEDLSKASKHEAMIKAIDGLVSRVDGHYHPDEFKDASRGDVRDCMTVYSLGDAHIGMLATKAETGLDHTLAKGESDLVEAMGILVSQARNTNECFIIDVGDFFHSDNMNNRTNGHGHALDVDGRYHKVLETGLNLTVKLIEMALAKHEVVRWRSAVGNHNEHTALMMSAFIKAYFRREPRVIVHDTPNMFMYHKFGKNLIGVTHGHTCKAEKLGEIMSVDCEDIWSDTRFRYWYTGHVHHQSVKEFPSCVVETFRTLAGKDAWHTGQGYRSGQDMRAITLHKDYGEISRNTVNIKMLTKG